MIQLIKALDISAGSEFRRQNILNYQTIERAINDFNDRMDKHSKDVKHAHETAQIYQGNISQASINKDLQSQINRLAVAPRDNSANEVVQARGDIHGNTYDTLKQHLNAWEEQTEINKDETIKAFELSKQEVLDIEYRFDPQKQPFLFVTELAPLTNAVMQSFWFDNKTSIVYMTQARSGGYMLTRLKPNGQYIDSSFIKGGGHGTHNGYRYIDNELWIYSFMENSEGQGAIVRFKYKPNVEYTYGTQGMQDVYTGRTNNPYMTPVINEHEGYILYRVEYPKSEWSTRNAMNYIEIRKLSDVDKYVDNVIYKFDIPLHLTSEKNPMQGVTFDSDFVYWYTGDSKPENPNYLTVFDIKTGKQSYQVNVDYGNDGGSYAGNFAEAEGLQMYYDEDTGKKALLLGVTVGGDGNRNHKIYALGQRGILEILKAKGTPYIMSDTGGRVRPLPINPSDLKNLTQIKEPGHYYLYTNHTLQIDDFPLPRLWRDAGWWLKVDPPQTNGDLVQTLMRNSFGRNMMIFKRVISSRGQGVSDWNYIPANSGKWERVPSFITDVSELNIVGMSFYLTTEDTKRLKGFPSDRKGVAGWNLTIEPSNTGGFIQKYTRNSITAPAELIIKNFDSATKGGPWTLHKGEIIK